MIALRLNERTKEHLFYICQKKPKRENEERQYLRILLVYVSYPSVFLPISSCFCLWLIRWGSVRIGCSCFLKLPDVFLFSGRSVVCGLVKLRCFFDLKRNEGVKYFYNKKSKYLKSHWQKGNTSKLQKKSYIFSPHQNCWDLLTYSPPRYPHFNVVWAIMDIFARGISLTKKCTRFLWFQKSQWYFWDFFKMFTRFFPLICPLRFCSLKPWQQI